MIAVARLSLSTPFPVYSEEYEPAARTGGTMEGKYEQLLT